MISAIPVTAIARACGGRLNQHPLAEAAKINGLAIDSRVVQSGDLFAALPGERVDGHDFAERAAQQGAAALLVQRELDADCPQIVVKDCQQALASVGRLAREQYDGVLVGITGSAGKTTAKNLLRAVLAGVGRTLATEGNFNNELGVPLTLSRLDPAIEFAVLEMGAGKPGDIAYLQRMVKPTVGVLLTVAPAHIEHFDSLDAIAETKAAILDDLPANGLAVINGDLPWVEQWRERATPAHVVTFGFGKGVDVRAKNIELLGFKGSTCRVKTPSGDFSLALALPGRQGIANALAAIAVAHSFGISNKVICEGLRSVQPAVGRGQAVTLPNGTCLVDDSYNANPAAVKAGIDVLAACAGRRRLILGSMLELGADSDALHREVGLAARDAGIEELWAVGERAAQAVIAFGLGGRVFESVATLCDAEPECHGADTVLVKASRGAALDVLVSHWTANKEQAAC